MEYNVSSYPWQSIYKILIGSIIPRPIGWISTVDREGRANLAPFSFFNVVCANPPHVLFCPMVRSTDGLTKDTLSNVRETGEFVVNIATEELASPLNLTSTELPSDIDEFEYASLSKLPGRIVRSPRVAESPVNFECKVTNILDLGTQPGSGSIVIGEVVYIHVEDSVLKTRDRINLDKLKPIGRLSGKAYCRITDIFELDRPPPIINKKDYQ